jgi:hypothetical protein
MRVTVTPSFDGITATSISADDAIKRRNNDSEKKSD